MAEECPQRVRALFDQAADLPPADRRAFLDACCPDDPDLRARVEQLLACDARLRAPDGAGGLLDGPVVRPPRRAISSAWNLPPTQVPSGPVGDAAAGAKAGTAAASLPERVGRYEVLEEIGRGGMGVVLRGLDPDLGRDVAVKVLLPHHQHDPVILSRFAEEAQVGGQLQHPGIVPVYEVGRSADQLPYFTMKRVRGRTLAELLRERSDPRQDLARFQHIFEQVCQTMAYAHSRGVIHRDLKPSNIMVGAFGEVQVMDWGLAKVLTRPEGDAPADAVRTARSEGDGGQTQAGWVAGTPAYMAREQAAGEVEQLDERCDVFGLGAILCEILTGRPPYGGPEDTQVFPRALRADLAEAFARLDACGADGELIRLARSSLAAQAAARPRDAGVLAAQMAAHRESMERRLRQAELAQAEARARAAEGRKRRRLTLGLAASVLLTALLAGGTWLWLERGREVRDRQALEALEQAERLHQQAKTGDDPDNCEPVGLARRAEALLEQGTGRPGPPERARALLHALDEEEADRRLLARVDEIQLVKVKEDTKALTFALRGAVPRYAAAFQEYGLGAGAVPPEQAAARIGQRPPQVRTQIVGALDDWLSLLREPSNARMAQWLEAVLMAADPDPWRKQLRPALRKQDQRALRRLADEVDVARQPPWTLTLLGMALRSGGSLPQGLALLRRAQGQYPGDFRVNIELGWQLDRDPDHTDDPVRFFRVAAALRPDSPLVRMTLATSLARRGELDKAVTVLREAAALKPELAAVHYNLGCCLGAKGDRDGAIRAYRRAIALEPDSVGAYRNLASALDKGGDRAGVNEVIGKLQQLVKRKPKEPDAFLLLGDLLLRKKDRDGAIAAYRCAKDAMPRDDFDARFNLGHHLRDARLFDEALAAFRDCAELATKLKRPDLRERAAREARETERLQQAGRDEASAVQAGVGRWFLPGAFW
jgi:serine/threonine-protein kinase